MKKGRYLPLLAVALALPFCAAAEPTFSAPAFVFLRPETSSFWRTATNDVVTVPIDLPSGASSATLSVSGVKYSQVHEGLAGGSYDLHLPPADSPDTENVYDLVLAFDNGEERTAKIAVVDGRLAKALGSTRCLAPETRSAWHKMGERAVVPVPYGTTQFSVSIGGRVVASESGLDGAQGWYAIGPVEPRDPVEISLDGYEVSLVGARSGMLLIVK